MSMTTLERVELTIEDFSIPCEQNGCEAEAARIVRTACDCVALVCVPCLTRMIVYYSTMLPMQVPCEKNPRVVTKVFKVSDFIKSVDPLA